jgi:peroxiredoxin
VVSVIVAAAAAMLWFSSSSAPQVGRGSIAPAIELPGLDPGQSYSLEALRGRVVLVNFWATWCKPCEDEMPAMNRLYRELEPQGFEMLAVSVGEDAATVRAFRDRLGIVFPILLDEQKEVARDWQTFAFPESLLVDRDGRILERYVGPREWDAPAYVERIRELLTAPEN